MKQARQNETENAPNRYSYISLPPVLDCATAPCVRDQLLRLLVDKVDVRVDMSDVCTMDTAAIAVFVECLRVARDHRVTFAVVRPPECALRLIRLTKLEQLLAGRFCYTKGNSQRVEQRRMHVRHNLGRPPRTPRCGYGIPPYQ